MAFLIGRKQPPALPSPVYSRGRKGEEAPPLSGRLRKGLRPRGDLAVVSSAAPGLTPRPYLFILELFPGRAARRSGFSPRPAPRTWSRAPAGGGRPGGGAAPGNGGGAPPATLGRRRPGRARAPAAAAIVRGAAAGPSPIPPPAARSPVRALEGPRASPPLRAPHASRVVTQIKSQRCRPRGEAGQPAGAGAWRAPAAQQGPSARQPQPGLRLPGSLTRARLCWADLLSWRWRMARAAPNVTPFLEIMLLPFFFLSPWL